MSSSRVIGVDNDWLKMLSAVSLAIIMDVMLIGTVVWNGPDHYDIDKGILCLE